MSKRRSEEVAKCLVCNLVNTGDLSRFVARFSDYVSWYGRFSRRPRECLTQAVIDELESQNIKLTTLREEKNA